MQIIEYGPPISLADVKRVIEAAETEASTNQWAMVIAVVDGTGEATEERAGTDHPAVVLDSLDQAVPRRPAYLGDGDVAQQSSERDGVSVSTGFHGALTPGCSNCPRRSQATVPPPADFDAVPLRRGAEATHAPPVLT